MPKKRKLLSPLSESLLLDFAQKLIKEEKLDSVTAEQINKALKEFRNSSEEQIDKYIQRITPELRYRIKRQYTKYIKSDHKSTNPGLAEYRLNDLSPKFRKELDNAVINSLSLIKTQNEQSMLKLEQRFRFWAVNPKVETDKNKQLSLFKETVVKENQIPKAAKKHLQFVIVDQERKLVGAMDRITAEENGAIGLVWVTRQDSRVVGKPGGFYPKVSNPKMHGDHYDREGVFYLLRDNWAVRRGYIVPRDGVAYADSLPDGLPGMPIGCRCLQKNIYHLSKIPKEYQGCITNKGWDFIKASE